MSQLKKHIWLINTIRRHGKISFRELSDLWERNKDMSDYQPLHRGTFNRWRDDIRKILHIDIGCQKSGGYLYYITNPDDINEDKLRRWMLDTFSVGNIIEENLSLKNRILVEEIPSGLLYLTPIMEAMKENKVIEMTYTSFRTGDTQIVTVEPYCIKLFEGRWYLLAKPTLKKKPRIYGLDVSRAFRTLMTRLNCLRIFQQRNISRQCMELFPRISSHKESFFEPMTNTCIISNLYRYIIHNG